MTIIKTKDLTGTALDWAVAKAEKIRVVVPQCWQDCGVKKLAKIAAAKAFPYGPPAWEPSENWEQGGPIIDSEKIHLEHFQYVGDWRAIHPKHFQGPPWASANGETALIAAMRAYAASVFGDEVNVPRSIISSHKEQP